MKKIIILTICALFFGMNNMAQAQETSVTLGLKAWYAKYELEIDDADDSVEFDRGLMYGPALNIRPGNFFFGVSYLMGGDFTYTEDLNSTTELEIDLDRTDLDLSVGYYLHPNVAVFLGYKKSEMDFEATETSVGSSSTEEQEWEYKGPAIGVTGNFPIGEGGAFLFGTLSYVKLDTDYKFESGDASGEEVEGPSIEFGVGFSSETMPVSLTVGYKYQKYEADENDEVLGFEETFSGLTLGVYFTF